MFILYNNLIKKIYDNFFVKIVVSNLMHFQDVLVYLFPPIGGAQSESVNKLAYLHELYSLLNKTFLL